MGGRKQTLGLESKPALTACGLLNRTVHSCVTEDAATSPLFFTNLRTCCVPGPVLGLAEAEMQKAQLLLSRRPWTGRNVHSPPRHFASHGSEVAESGVRADFGNGCRVISEGRWNSSLPEPCCRSASFVGWHASPGRRRREERLPPEPRDLCSSRWKHDCSGWTWRAAELQTSSSLSPHPYLVALLCKIIDCLTASRSQRARRPEFCPANTAVERSVL